MHVCRKNQTRAEWLAKHEDINAKHMEEIDAEAADTIALAEHSVSSSEVPSEDSSEESDGGPDIIDQTIQWFEDNFPATTTDGLDPG